MHARNMEISVPATGISTNLGGPFNLNWQRTAGGYLDLDTRIWFFTDSPPASRCSCSLRSRMPR
jgi:hypothetical protein